MIILGYIQLASEVLAFLTAVMVARSLRNKWWLWIPFLLYTCVVEIASTYLTNQNPDYNNLWLYNPYIIVSLAFYAWFVIHNTSLVNKTKNILNAAIVTVSILCFIWYVIWGDTKDIISYILNFGALVICILCLLFFYLHIMHPQKYSSLTEVPAFWMVSGILVFHAGISIYMAIYKFLIEAHIEIMGVKIQNLIPQVLSLVLYTTIIIGLIKWRHVTS